MPSLLSTTTEGPSYSCHHSRLNTYREIMKHQSFTFLFIYWFVCLSFNYLAASGLSCGTWNLHHIVQLFRCRALTLYSWYLTSVVATCGLNCAEAYRTRVCRPKIKPRPLRWEADSYPLDCPGSHSFIFLIFYLYLIILGLIILKIGHVNISPTQDRELRQRGIRMSFPSTCFSSMWFESSPSGMVTMLCWASRSQLNRDICTHSQSVGCFQCTSNCRSS